MNNEWVSVKNELPKDDKKWVLFIQWKMEWDIVIAQHYDTWENIKTDRKFDLENNYTHWRIIQPPQTQKP